MAKKSNIKFKNEFRRAPWKGVSARVNLGEGAADPCITINIRPITAYSATHGQRYDRYEVCLPALTLSVRQAYRFAAALRVATVVARNMTFSWRGRVVKY